MQLSIKIYWDLVSRDVTKLALKFLNEGGSIKDINQTFIVLISKVKNALSMSSFRPISLRNVIYKIIAKTLANRLKRPFHILLMRLRVALSQVD